MSTVRAIAEQAHVSIATVSRVLNNRDNVSERTRLLVLEAAQELDYPIPDAAREVIVSRSVLVVTRQGIDPQAKGGPTGWPFERAVLAGVEAVFNREEVVTKLQQSTMTPDEAERIANEAGVAGLIILGGVVPIDFLQRLQELGKPFVVAGSHVRPLEVNCAMADVSSGVRQVVDHLAERGRRQLGLVNGPETTNTSPLKLDGFRLGLAVNSLVYSGRQTVSCEFSPDDGYRQTKRLLEQFPPVDAIVYADDMIALGGLKALREAGRRVPEDVAVTGFGHYDIARYTSPTLTTVDYDLHGMGTIAARRLCALLSEPDQRSWMIVVPTTLIPGESS